MDNSLNVVELLAQIKDYTAQLKKDPTSDKFVLLAQNYTKLGLLDSALNALRQGLIHHPEHHTGQLMLAQLLVEDAQYDDAVAIYDKILGKNGDSVEALLGLARLDIAQANKERAQVCLDKVCQLEPDNPQLELIFQQLRELSDVNDAVGSVPLVTSTAAELYLKQGLREKAVDVYKTLVQQQPDNEALSGRLNELLEQSVDNSDIKQKQLLNSLEKWLSSIKLRRKHV